MLQCWWWFVIETAKRSLYHHCQWSIDHGPLDSIQLGLVLPPPSSSSCTWSSLSTFLPPDGRWFTSRFWDTRRNISQTLWNRLPIFQVDLHCALHRVATSSCRGHVDELATEPFLLLHRGHETGYRRSWNCCDRRTCFFLIWKHFCFILSTGTKIRIDSVMCLRSSSRGRNTSASVTVYSYRSLSRCSWFNLFLCSLVYLLQCLLGDAVISVWPSRFYFLILSCCSTGSSQFFFHSFTANVGFITFCHNPPTAVSPRLDFCSTLSQHTFFIYGHSCSPTYPLLFENHQSLL